MQKIKIFLFVLIPVFFIIGLLIGTQLIPQKIQNIERIQSNINLENTKEMTLLGVTSEGRGMPVKMTVEVKPGNGLVLVNIDNVLADYLTQLSARTAAKVASNITRISLSNMDVIYNIKANAEVVAGPSAGAAMTIATIAAIQNKDIDHNVLVTGGVDENGIITQVGNIKEKARAAKDINATTFIIPQAAYNVGYEKTKSCKILDNLEYCQIQFLPKEEDLSKALEINTLPIKTVEEAAKIVLK
ncbi:hypothetical protein J4216_03120 [Candidatus Woesearchaeota archaeon]|nr:hypothetical protein [Candidatus Woesearchaeota archaeon]